MGTIEQPYQNEGIDKIKIVLHPTILNPESKKKHPDTRNKLTLHPVSTLTSLPVAVHAEFIDPSVDMHMAFAKALYELVKKQVVQRPDQVLDRDMITYLYNNLSHYIVYIQELEFFFDFRKNDLTVDPEAVRRGEFDPYYEETTPTNTLYTSDFRQNRRTSLGIIYDRQEKLLKDNNIAHVEIYSNPYKKRLEFRLCRNNCEYLHLKNLKGSYIDIINRYRPLLATLYNRYFKNNISTSGTENKQFDELKREAEQGRLRYTGKELCKADPIPKSLMRERSADTLLRMLDGLRCQTPYTSNPNRNSDDDFTFSDTDISTYQLPVECCDPDATILDSDFTVDFRNAITPYVIPPYTSNSFDDDFNFGDLTDFSKYQMPHRRPPI